MNACTVQVLSKELHLSISNYFDKMTLAEYNIVMFVVWNILFCHVTKHLSGLSLTGSG